MASEWQIFPLERAIYLNPQVALRRGHDYPFVPMDAIVAGQRSVSATAIRSAGGGARFSDGDTLMARITPCLENGKIARFVGEGAAFGSTEFIVGRGRDGVSDSGFVYYLMTSPECRAYAISQMSGTTGRQRVPFEALGRFVVSLPPLPEQRAIAHILATLDDKIELNRQMSAMLEAMARALFESWFVRFDPVRAKAEGRDTGLPADIAALFPDSFEQSEIGEVPKGWSCGTVADLCAAIYSGGTPSTQTAAFWNGDVPWLSSGETRATFIIDTDKRITTAGVAKSSTRLARVLSTVIASAGQGNTRGQTSLLGIDCYVNQSVVVLSAKITTSSPTHLFFDLERRYEEFRRVSDGHSSRGSLTTKLLAELKAVRPSVEVISRFESTVAPLVSRAFTTLRDSRELVRLRDTLLPKLISGDLRVPDAERFLADAGV